MFTPLPAEINKGKEIDFKEIEFDSYDGRVYTAQITTSAGYVLDINHTIEHLDDDDLHASIWVELIGKVDEDDEEEIIKFRKRTIWYSENSQHWGYLDALFGRDQWQSFTKELALIELAREVNYLKDKIDAAREARDAAICEVRAAGVWSLSEIAENVGVTKAQICNILNK